MPVMGLPGVTGPLPSAYDPVPIVKPAVEGSGCFITGAGPH